MARIYGIDLGTTYSGIACVDEHGKPVVLQNSEGEMKTPSVVFFESRDNVVVGQAAKEVVSISIDRCVSNIKRVMGDPYWEREFYGRRYKPQEVSALILQKVVNDAGRITGETIRDVILTCPAYFDARGKEATREAGILAGLNVLQVIPEPTAAALAYGIELDKPQTILVYDLGGSTFDITLLQIKSDETNVICAGGDRQLGGKDWDDAVVFYFAEQFAAATGTPVDTLLEDQDTYQEFLNAAELCKKLLSSRSSVTQALRFGSDRVKVSLNREVFDRITAQYLERTLSLADHELERAREMGHTRIDQLLLVGGATYMPQVIEAVKKRFPFPLRQLDPNQVMAKGAALFGYKYHSKEKSDSVAISRDVQTAVTPDHGLELPRLKAIVHKKITNVTSKSFGIVVKSQDGLDVVRNIIFRNDSVPILKSVRLELPEAESSQIQLRLMENRKDTPEVALEHCLALGMAIFYFQTSLPEGSKVDIDLSLSPDGLLTLTGRELTTGREIKASFLTEAVEANPTDENPLVIRNQVFISYSHRDRKWLDQFLTMLNPVLRKGAFSLWDDTRIEPGMRWKEEIEHALASAKVAVLLVSKEFLASGFIIDNELPVLLDAAKRDGLPIIWILLKPCLYEETEIHAYQAAHDISKPLAKLKTVDREAVLADICKLIKRKMQSTDLPLFVA